jgi:hypothetical protein
VEPAPVWSIVPSNPEGNFTKKRRTLFKQYADFEDGGTVILM